MQCLNCNANMIGNGYTSVMECEHSVIDTSSYAPDEGPIYCAYEPIESTEEAGAYFVSRSEYSVVVEVVGVHTHISFAYEQSETLNSNYCYDDGGEFTFTSVTGELFNHSLLAKAEFGDDYSMYISYMAQWAHLVPLTPLEYAALPM